MGATPAEHGQQRRAARHERIIEAARALAEADGWDQVTTRRLAEAIGHSQPVLYDHFPDGKGEIMNAVALRGFTEIAGAVSQEPERDDVESRIRRVIVGYLDFAVANPAVYEAMFTLAITATFASDRSEPELTSAFACIVSALERRAGPSRDVDTDAEVLWSTIHGLATLERAHRLRPDERTSRIDATVELFTRGETAPPSRAPARD